MKWQRFRWRPFGRDFAGRESFCKKNYTRDTRSGVFWVRLQIETPFLSSPLASRENVRGANFEHMILALYGVMKDSIC